MNEILERTPPQPITAMLLFEARRLMRAGASLQAAAARLHVPARDLDISLWRTLGSNQ